jgi:molybdopterin/thiamine biosynthesis adenylyltransferase
MSFPPERFARAEGRVNLKLLATRRVVAAGVGSVGSQVAKELANVNVGKMTLIDGKPLKSHHLGRHTLTTEYVGSNKALGMALYFSKEIPALEVHSVPREIDKSMTDDELDALLKDADLIVAATDNRGVQRRIGRRALSLDIPAIFPGLYESNGGEVFVQPGPELPCFLCRDGFRPANETLRGVAATNPDILAIIQLASQLGLAILDRSTDYRRMLRPERGEIPQLFVQNGLTLARRPVPWRPNCPSCGVGPAPSNRFTHQHPDDPLRAQVLEGLLQRSTQRPPAPQPELRQESDSPILPIIGGAFQLIAGGLGVLVGGFLMLWAWVIGILLVLAVVGGAFWLFIVLLGQLGGH